MLLPALMTETCKRHFSHCKFALLLVLVLNCELRLRVGSTKYVEYFQRDLEFCHTCFEHQKANCDDFLQTIELNSQPSAAEFITNFILPTGSGQQRRRSQVLQSRKLDDDDGGATKIIGKYFGHKYTPAEQQPLNRTSEVFERLLFPDRQKPLEGFQLCPSYAIERFVQYFQKAHKVPREHMIGLYMLYDVQLLLLPELYGREFPVPQPLAVCGFSLFERYAGRTLQYFYEAEFELKVRIAKQLLEIALRFTSGFDDYRFYITDLTADNLVYDEQLGKLSLVDLNTLFIVDARGLRPDAVHTHAYIECDDCFAYVPQDLCAYSRSDLNVFAACQFLREDLRKNRARGFLQPVPESMQGEFPQLQETLDACVDCPEGLCANRLEIARDLMAIFDDISLHFRGK